MAYFLSYMPPPALCDTFPPSQKLFWQDSGKSMIPGLGYDALTHLCLGQVVGLGRAG